MKTNSTPLRILVIDDEPIIRFVLSMVFKKNAIVKAVDSAEEAIAELKSQFYDLCFLDIILPGMNGLEAMKIINEISPKTKVTIMTGNSLDESMKTLIDDLAYEFIEKPFELSRIKEIANSVDGMLMEQQSQ
jgi:DNA-binding NtrC family response regulator